MFNQGVKIIGFGSYLPGDAITNQLVIDKHRINTTDQWIRTNLGIHKRHWAEKGINTSDIAVEASEKALLMAGISANKLNRIVLGTSTADHTNVATACKVQHALGAVCPAFDIISACASFIFALETSVKLVQSGVENVLVAGVDLKSRFIDKNDRKFLPIFGDGGAAFILASCERNKGFLKMVLWTDGSRYNDVLNPAGGSAMPASIETVEKSLHSTRMMVDGKTAIQEASSIMADLSRKVCLENGLNLADITYVVPHHANIQIMNLLMEKLELPVEKLFSTIDYTGNMVSGAVAFALSELLQTKTKTNDLILLVTIGAGVTGGAALYRVP